jgi:CubicO group peptidase (beta-lactamase class C family)
MASLQADLEAVAEQHDFSGVAVAWRAGRRIVELARGDADRANHVPITLETRFGTASVCKGWVALVIAWLVERGDLRFETPIRDVLGADLPLIDPAVTIEHLLGHTSGIGDYLDETTLDVDDYAMPVPVHRLDRPEAFLPILEGHPQLTPPGETFAYNNGAFVILSIAIERASGQSFYDLVDEVVLGPADMRDTAFDRSDRLPAETALGYLEDGRTNVLHLPVRGVGDGGAATTVRDLGSFWQALFAGRILPMPAVERLIAPHSDVPAEQRRYGLGFWLAADGPAVALEGMDAGASARTAYDPSTEVGFTVLSNTSSRAWPLVELLDERLSTRRKG